MSFDLRVVNGHADPVFMVSANPYAHPRHIPIDELAWAHSQPVSVVLMSPHNIGAGRPARQVCVRGTMMRPALFAATTPLYPHADSREEWDDDGVSDDRDLVADDGNGPHSTKAKRARQRHQQAAAETAEPRALFPDPGEWRVVRWGDFKDLLASQLARPERLRDNHRLPCFVQIHEWPRGTQGAHEGMALLPSVADKLQIDLPLRRGARSHPVTYTFTLRAASDPTREPAAALQQPVLPAAIMRKRCVPERFGRPWEFKISRDEAVYDMSHASTRIWSSLLARLRRALSLSARRKWQALLSGKDAEEQLWGVAPPKGAFADPGLRAWAQEKLQAAGYDAGTMLVEWEIFWRRKGRA